MSAFSVFDTVRLTHDNRYNIVDAATAVIFYTELELRFFHGLINLQGDVALEPHVGVGALVDRFLELVRTDRRLGMIPLIWRGAFGLRGSCKASLIIY